MNSSDDRFPLSRREWLFLIAFWMGYAALLVASRLFDRGAASQLAGIATNAVLEALAWVALTPLIFALAVRLEGRDRRVTWAVLAIAGVAIAFMVGWAATELRQSLMPTGGGPRGGFEGGRFEGVRDSIPRGRPRGQRGPPIWFGVLNALVLYAGTVSAGVARAYSRRYQLRREEAARREARLEAQLAGARLESLQRQLDPHFLFNTLNTVSALLERDPRGVRRVIARLGELLRHNLERGGEAEATLRDELAVLARYVEIMQVRFQGRLTVETNADDAIMDALVPTMILQPIVENAIKHGAERIASDARIEISAAREGGDVVVRVRDNGPGVMPSGEARTGVGLSNSRARLEQLYGGADRLTVSTHAGGGAVAELRVPYHVEPVRSVDAG